MRHINIEWGQLLFRDDILILDCETTGTGPQDEVIEIGIINTNGVVVMHEYIQPSIPIPAEATAVHGFTVEKLRDLGALPYSDRASIAIEQHLFRTSLVLAYNVAFDYRLLCQTAAKYEMVLPDTDYRCAMLDYAEYRGVWDDRRKSYRWHKLGDAAKHEGVEVDGQSEHTAIGDCLTTLDLMRAVWLGGSQ